MRPPMTKKCVGCNYWRFFCGTVASTWVDVDHPGECHNLARLGTRIRKKQIDHIARHCDLQSMTWFFKQDKAEDLRSFPSGGEKWTGGNGDERLGGVDCHI